jgi:curved DNA-binding protein CbpA
MTMPDRIPSDDLYLRLGVAPDADTGAIDRAWRSLLKQHHPDVAGAGSLEAAKKINVAHDWLADPDRRARYDAAVARRTGRTSRRTGGRAPGGGRGPDVRAPEPAPRDGLDEAFDPSAAPIRSFLRRIDRLTDDDLDRLSLSAPHADSAMLRPFVPAELRARLDALDRLLAARLPARLRADPVAAAAATAYGHALVLEPFALHHFADPELLLDGMRHGWEAAVGQPRYGPNGREVRALIERLRRATPEEARALARGWEALGVREDPWPDDARQDDYAALRLSAALARRDAAAAPDLSGLPDDERRAMEAAFARTAHAITLRPVFSAQEFARLGTAWAPLGLRARERQPVPTVRRARA